METPSPALSLRRHFPLSPLPAYSLRDESLALSASQRSNESRRQLHNLVAETPAEHRQAYWTARAPHTPWSRLQLAGHLYSNHLEASAQLAYATAALPASQCEPVLALTSPTTEPATSAPAAYAVLLKLDDDTKVRLTGALAISSTPQGGYLLYLPGELPALRAFGDITALGDYLKERLQRFWPWVDPARLDSSRCRLAVDPAPLQNSMKVWIADLLEHQARTPTFDLAQYSQSLFSQTPALPGIRPEIAAAANLNSFGNLDLEAPLSTRWAALRHQVEALEANRHQAQPLRVALAKLEAAHSAASTAIDALLTASAPADLFNLRSNKEGHLTALQQARSEGLRAEFSIQHLLGLIDDNEQRLCAVLDDSGMANIAVASNLSLVLAHGEQAGSQQEIFGAMLISPGQALPADTTGVLLYLPGTGGGLQRFASRREMEQSLFMTTSSDPALTLAYSHIPGEATDYGVQAQLHRIEQQAVALTHRPAAEHDAALPKLLEQARHSLQVPLPSARRAALELIEEQRQTELLADQLPEWLKKLDTPGRERLRDLIHAYIAAMHRSQALLDRDLAPREAFVDKRLQQQMQQDFALQHSAAVSLDLPEKVEFKRELIIGAGVPGAPYREVPYPSKARSQVSLTEMALNNLDDALRQRLAFMHVNIETDHPEDRQALLTGIDKDWLVRTLPRLDAAGAYEQHLRAAFMGAPDESPYANAYRRECLSEPLRLMLQLQNEVARQQRNIDDSAWRIVDIAIDASTADAWRADGHDIVLHAAVLRSGGKAAQEPGVTLSGITFIHDRNSQQTVLYLPDAPDGNHLRAYVSLEAARLGLFRLSLNHNLRDYLAERALLGSPQAHAARLDQAHLNHFDRIIAVGTSWPATTSLAVHLLDANMGCRIEAHRQTSRSSYALYMERFALKSDSVFNYVRMAIGMVPFVGTVLALHNAWTSANKAVTAIRDGDLGTSLAQLESVLLSLIDAFMDLAPGLVIAPPARQRQVSRLLSGVTRRQPRKPGHAFQALRSFAGYEYTGDIQLAGITPGTVGLYRNIYRHPKGNFIVSMGRIYQVDLSEAPRTWRLYGTASKTYKQPIALDEFGEWATHGQLYGTLIKGGLAGGGNLLGRLADGLEPVWPNMIREYLPRWWVDRIYRRRDQLKSSLDSLYQRIEQQDVRAQDSFEVFNTSKQTPAPTRSLEAHRVATLAADQASLQQLELCKKAARQLEELLTLTSGNRRQQLGEALSEVCTKITLNLQNRTVLNTSRQLDMLDELAQAVASPASTVDFSRLARIKQLRIQLLGHIDEARDLLDDMLAWSRRITKAAHKREIGSDVLDAIARVPAHTTTLMRTSQLLRIILRYDGSPSIEWLLLAAEVRPMLSVGDRTLASLLGLSTASFTQRQHKLLLQQASAFLEQLQNHLKSWQLRYPQLIDVPHAERLHQHLDEILTFNKRAPEPAPPRRPVASKQPPRVFETEDGTLLIGDEQAATARTPRRFTITGAGGHTEIYEQQAGGRWQLTNALPPPTHLPEPARYIGEARRRLLDVEALSERVRGYAQRYDTLPADLEDILCLEAKALQERANRLHDLAPDNPLIGQLYGKANQLIDEGRRLRIEHSLQSETPTDGMLDYLMDEGALEIIRLGKPKELAKRPDGRRDFLQEYEIRKLQGGKPIPHWYAHFHYESAAAPFEQFAKAHLKTANQRHLGLQWQVAQGQRAEPIWRGALSKPLAIKHFQAL
ncbi:hypothetical protein DCO48_11795 [Pseudomonas sp. SDI]|uniref:dermonecrotic toxin domain-containing protein n=1 Tax=Pseudomonas sp. SDI TaxID=2170734 RepID=UPI000DE76D9B|nr:DUF6543 domain-containing protein [Pseudomonas sp. SDI]PWB32805.1 hypothetical protein DCO48_11795 [Pseudomonas sp. SDI]